MQRSVHEGSGVETGSGKENAGQGDADSTRRGAARDRSYRNCVSAHEAKRKQSELLIKGRNGRLLAAFDASV